MRSAECWSHRVHAERSRARDAATNWVRHASMVEIANDLGRLAKGVPSVQGFHPDRASDHRRNRRRAGLSQGRAAVRGKHGGRFVADHFARKSAFDRQESDRAGSGGGRTGPGRLPRRAVPDSGGAADVHRHGNAGGYGGGDPPRGLSEALGTEAASVREAVDGNRRAVREEGDRQPRGLQVLADEELTGSRVAVFEAANSDLWTFW